MKRKYKEILSIVMLIIFIIINIIPFKANAIEQSVNNVYFLDSQAKDNGDGSTKETAWNSLKQVNKHLFQPGDKLLIKNGSVFNGTLYPKGSGAEGSPIIIDVYGDGDEKPVINAGGKAFIAQQKDWQGPFVNFSDESTIGAAIYLYNQEYWEINNISVTNTSENANEADRSGIRIEGYDYGVINHIYIRNCEIKNVVGFNSQDDIYPVIPTKSDGSPMFPDLTDPGTNPNNSKIFSGARTTHRTGGINLVTYTARLSEAKNDKGVVEQALDTTKKITIFNDVLVENNTISNCSANGITTTNVKGTLDDDAFRHTNVVIRNNEIDHVTRSGIITLYTSGVLVEKNIIDNFQSTYLGYGCGIWADRANDMVYQYNEVKNGQNYNDGMAFNLDDMTRNGVIQYNYTHDNVGGGYMLHVRPKSYNRNHTIRYNISINDSGTFAPHVAQIVAVGEDKDPETQIENAKVYNNTFISNKDVHPVYKGNEVTYTNNIWYFTNSNLANRTSPFDFGENSTFNNNIYYGVNQPNKNGVPVDSNAKVINPQFMNENVFNLSKDEVLQAVKLKNISSLIGSGVDLEDNGGLDFYGYNLTKGNINIGAYNGVGHETVKVPYSMNSTSDEVKKYLSSGDLQTDVINETPTEANSKWVNTTFNQEPLVYTKSNGAYVKFEWSGTGITPILKSGAGAGEGAIEVYTKDNMSTPFKSVNINTYSANPDLITVKDFENMFEKDTDCVIIVKNSSTSQKALNVVKFNVDVNESLSSECEVDTLENVFMNSGKYVISYYDDSVSIPLTSSYAIDSCKEINSEAVITYKVISGEGIITDNTLICNTPGVITVEATVEYKGQIAKKQAEYIVTKADKPQVNEKPISPTLPKSGTYEAEDSLVSKFGTFASLEASTASKGSQLKTDKEGDSIELSFYGNKISVYGRKAVGTSILKIEVYSLDDGEEILIETKEVDCYKATMEDQALIYEKEFDSNNSYKIKVLNTRTQNPSANGSYNMIIDYFVVGEKTEVIEVNKDELRAVLEQAEDINLDNYTDESKALLVALIEEAKILLNDKNALQEDVDKLKEDIIEAIDSLVEKDNNIEVVDKKALEITIDYAEEVKINCGLENIVPAVVNEFESALEEAKVILAKEDASQEEVDKITERLVKVIHMLDFKQGDKKQLIKLVEIINALEKDNYKPSTWSALEIQLSEANSVIEDENAMEEVVATAYKKLVKAYLDLRLIPNKEKLEELINKTKELDLSKYTEDSVANLKIALERAVEVLKNNEVNESDVEIATNNLEESINNLVAKDDDSSKDDKNNEESNKDENNNGDNGNNKENDVDTGNTNNNGNKENNKLPATGGIDTIGLSTISIISILLGAVLSKKRR